MSILLGVKYTSFQKHRIAAVYNTYMILKYLSIHSNTGRCLQRYSSTVCYQICDFQIRGFSVVKHKKIPSITVVQPSTQTLACELPNSNVQRSMPSTGRPWGRRIRTLSTHYNVVPVIPKLV
jgi:hypothetical protein